MTNNLNEEITYYIIIDKILEVIFSRKLKERGIIAVSIGFIENNKIKEVLIEQNSVKREYSSLNKILETISLENGFRANIINSKNDFYQLLSKVIDIYSQSKSAFKLNNFSVNFSDSYGKYIPTSLFIQISSFPYRIPGLKMSQIQCSHKFNFIDLLYEYNDKISFHIL